MHEVSLIQFNTILLYSPNRIVRCKVEYKVFFGHTSTAILNGTGTPTYYVTTAGMLSVFIQPSNKIITTKGNLWATGKPGRTYTHIPAHRLYKQKAACTYLLYITRQSQKCTQTLKFLQTTAFYRPTSNLSKLQPLLEICNGAEIILTLNS